jgi:quercetin dioxygenase-like cupin family protein
MGLTVYEGLSMLVKDKGKSIAEPVLEEGAEKVRKAVLIGPEEGAPNFILRRFDLEAGGFTPFHSHDWEHVVYVLEGSGKLVSKETLQNLKPGASVFVAPGEKHQFVADEKSPLVFLCTIPRH